MILANLSPLDLSFDKNCGNLCLNIHITTSCASLTMMKLDGDSLLSLPDNSDRF